MTGPIADSASAMPMTEARRRRRMHSETYKKQNEVRW